ncbi:S9 family peptidase [Flavobacterium limi]|uniref:Acylaminoacyl-peptidase n=1 Tax=Flavobacterium limi TaxID=2045105 RepID=A0ABQ1TI14_9FLAO|nr:prolyl oligopeptidase family serine peptidase [Flavobacterium limi]GGE94786.1 acylaminoacyl-peptidase [Flavobacterium limi]
MNTNLNSSARMNFKFSPQIAVLFFILPLVTCPLWGQGAKKQLTPDDYPLWGELRSDQLSRDSKWISYRIQYQNGTDSLFVKNTTTAVTYSFAGCEQSDFTESNHFITQKNNQLTIMNLNTGNKETIPDVLAYAYSKKADRLMLLKPDGTESQVLRSRRPSESRFEEIKGVKRFSVSPDGAAAVFSVVSNSQQAIGLLHLTQTTQIEWITGESDFDFDGFVWQKDGKSVAFLGQGRNLNENMLHYYILKTKKLYRLDAAGQPQFPKDRAIVLGSTYKITIADDLQSVFVSLKKKNSPGDAQPKAAVEIWHTKDKWIYPQEQKEGKFDRQSKVAVWFPITNAFMPVTSNELPKLMLTGDYRYAILSNPKAYEPQFEYSSNRDYYLLNLKTGQQELFLKNHAASAHQMLVSPGGKYIAYFSANHWWVYSIREKRHTNITAATKAVFYGKVFKLVTVSAYGNPGWTVDDKEIVLYDHYDLWAIKTDGSSYRRITKGREAGIRYRIADSSPAYKTSLYYDGFRRDVLDLEKEVLLRAEGDDGKTGYFIRNKQSELQAIVYGDYFIDQLFCNEKKNTFFYRQQKFDLPPALFSKTVSSAPKLIFQSNPHHFDYDWGRSELVHYQNSEKENLKGVLLYPAQWSAGKKYPMVVHIYEYLSNELHLYRNPSLFSEEGFNAANLTQQGYFILLPDILHKEGNPGISATDCVVSGTKKVIETGLVNPNKIGLIGHSFGGYETAFIITQTNLFAAAIAGAAVTDLNSYFLNVGWDTGKPDLWRMNKEQWRIGKSPYEDPLAYTRNSPVCNAEHITTPLLLWTGKKDQHVDWHQSVEYYMALRRLGKKNVTLFYTDEAHSLLNPENQKDFTQRVGEWFGCYLKNEALPSWIEKGTE